MDVGVYTGLLLESGDHAGPIAAKLFNNWGVPIQKDTCSNPTLATK